MRKITPSQPKLDESIILINIIVKTHLVIIIFSYLESNKKSLLSSLLINISLYGNFKKLFRVTKIEGQLDCLHGIRFLSMGWVVLGHMFLDLYYNIGVIKINYNLKIFS